jgi:hypothetical protein
VRPHPVCGVIREINAMWPSLDSSRCFALKRTDSLKKPCPLETCFGLVIFLVRSYSHARRSALTHPIQPPGTVSIDAWTSHSLFSAQPPSYIRDILPGVLEMCHLHRPRVIMLSDEAKSVLLKVQFFDGDLALSSWRQRSEWPVRMHLAFLLWRDALKHRCLRLKNRPHVDHVQGALPSNLLLDKMLAHSPSGMADFDLFTMERKPQLWKHFLKWKEVAQACASQHALRIGTVLLLLSGKTIVSELPWRSPTPLWTLPDTDRSMVMQHPRQRDEVAEGALASSDGLTFHVTHLARVEDDTYSQVVFGVLKKHNVVVSSEMCLKLFDERRFPVGDYDDNDCTPFAERLDSWNVAEDMARREEAAYDRLRYLQGTMLPHSYGFYQVSVIHCSLYVGHSSNTVQDAGRSFMHRLHHGESVWFGSSRSQARFLASQGARRLCACHINYPRAPLMMRYRRCGKCEPCIVHCAMRGSTSGTGVLDNLSSPPSPPAQLRITTT